MVLAEGDLLSTNATGMTEVEFDGGMLFRVGENSQVAIMKMGERPIITVDRGRAAVQIEERDGRYGEMELAFPSGRVVATGTASARIDVLPGGAAEVRVMRGDVQLETLSTSLTRVQGGELVLIDSQGGTDFTALRTAREDNFDLWNRERESALAAYNQSPYVEEYIVGAEDLDGYGEWVYADRYRTHAWRPYVVDTWQPYYNGRWYNSSYYGWTWIPAEPWGYVTHHYGSWNYDPYYGWLWVPGYTWRPAYVYWVDYDDYIGWVPLNYYGYPVVTAYPYYTTGLYISFIDVHSFSFVHRNNFHHRHGHHFAKNGHDWWRKDDSRHRDWWGHKDGRRHDDAWRRDGDRDGHSQFVNRSDDDRMRRSGRIRVQDGAPGRFLARDGSEVNIDKMTRERTRFRRDINNERLSDDNPRRVADAPSVPDRRTRAAAFERRFERRSETERQGVTNRQERERQAPNVRERMTERTEQRRFEPADRPTRNREEREATTSRTATRRQLDDRRATQQPRRELDRPDRNASREERSFTPPTTRRRLDERPAATQRMQREGDRSAQRVIREDQRSIPPAVMQRQSERSTPPRTQRTEREFARPDMSRGRSQGRFLERDVVMPSRSATRAPAVQRSMPERAESRRIEQPRQTRRVEPMRQGRSSGRVEATQWGGVRQSIDRSRSSSSRGAERATARSERGGRSMEAFRGSGSGRRGGRH
jgi:hypothetical protein